MVIHTYKEILSLGECALEALGEDTDRLRSFTSAHNNINDLSTLRCLVGNRPEIEMFDKAIVEYQRSLSSVSTGHYRQANSSLRLFAELALSAVLFSANEIHLRLWFSGRKDINWNSIVCLKHGVFSKEFINVFFTDLSEFGRQYQAIATSFYRECSEFVHGNLKTYDCDHKIAFNPDLFDDWYARTESVNLIVKFAYLLRYTMFAEQEVLNKIEPIALEDFPMVPALQAQFGRPHDE